MAKNLYIDASHPEETRIVLKSNLSIEEYEYENKNKINFKFNSYFPIKSLNLMRGVFVAAEDGIKDLYIDKIFNALKKETRSSQERFSNNKNQSEQSFSIE